MTTKLKVLFLEDSKLDLDLSIRELTREGLIFETIWSRNREDYLVHLTKEKPGLILADYRVPGFEGLDALEIALLQDAKIPFIYVSGAMDDEVAIDALHKGATDYVLKDNLRRLGPSIRRALADQEERTARRWATNRLRESENIYESLVGNIPQNIVREDKAGRITYANQPFCKLLSKRVEEVIGKNLSDLLPTTNSERMRSESEFSHRSGKTRHTIETIGTPTGQNIQIEIVRVPLRDPEGGDVGLQIMFWDVTEKRARERAAEEQARLLDLAPVAIVVVDGSGTVSYWNQGAEDIHGLARANAIGKRLSELIRFGRDVFDSALESACSEGLYSFEFEIDDADGNKKTLLSRWTVAAESSGGESRIIVMNTDVTENKKLEKQFFHAQRLEGIGTLACGVAHDLNNILGPIMMATELMRKHSDDPVIVQCLDTSLNCAKRGANIVKQLLTIGRGATGERAPIDLRIVLAELVKMANETFPKNIVVRNLMPTGLWTVMGDATQLHQVFLNLFVNGRDAMPKGGEITVSAQNFEVDPKFARFHANAKPGPHLMISVEDSGMGIPTELKERIFDPFFTTKEEGKGTGLGLATTMGITKSHGGFIAVYSENGKGTTFNIYLPAEVEAQAVDKEEQTTVMAQVTGLSVLIAEDEPSVSNLLRAFLTNQGYRAVVGNNGVEALALFERNPEEFHLVITDIDMPEMNGYDFATHVRRIRKDLPIVVATGLGTAEQITPFERDLQIQHFLFKPFDSRTLLKTVRDARNSAQELPSNSAQGF
jgi:PAS domain S-box-containing protein